MQFEKCPPSRAEHTVYHGFVIHSWIWFYGENTFYCVHPVEHDENWYKAFFDILPSGVSSPEQTRHQCSFYQEPIIHCVEARTLQDALQFIDQVRTRMSLATENLYV